MRVEINADPPYKTNRSLSEVPRSG